MRISYYKNIFNDHRFNPDECSVDDVLNAIKSGVWENEMNLLRSLEYKSDEYNKLKTSLPGVRFSGTFSDGTDNGLIKHSGFICLDFDSLDDLNLDELAADEFIYACWISPSTEGTKALVKIPPENHKGSFRALRERYPDMDVSCKNVSRLCFVSYDPELHLNRDSKIFTEIVEEIEKGVVNSGEVSNIGTKEIIDFILNGFKSSGIEFSSHEGGRHDWMCKFAYELNNFGVSEFDSQNYCSIYACDGFTHKEISGIIKRCYSSKSADFNSKAHKLHRKQVINPKTNTKVTEVVEVVESIDIYEQLAQYEIHPSMEVVYQDSAWQIESYTTINIAHFGNIVAVTGLAGSRKSTFIDGVIGAALGKDMVLGMSFNVENKGVLVFDTEQPRNTTLKHTHWINRIAGLDRKKKNDQFRCFNLKEVDAETRLEYIDRAIKRSKDLGVVVIDGVVDICPDFMDSASSKTTIQKILEWTSEKNIMLIGVLHRNHGAVFKMRGHLGTEFQNKADVVIDMSTSDLDDEYSTTQPPSKVTCKKSREPKFRSFYFTQNRSGMPVMCDDVGHYEQHEEVETIETIEEEVPF